MGGCIFGTYEDYGNIAENGIIYDIYELMAIWNNKKLYKAVKELGYNNPARISSEDKELSNLIRYHGINIACYDEDHLKCKYPIKFVSDNCNMTYEECENISLSDEEQGFCKHNWNNNLTYKEYTEKMKNKKKQISQKEAKQRLEYIFEELDKFNKKVF